MKFAHMRRPSGECFQMQDWHARLTHFVTRDLLGRTGSAVKNYSVRCICNITRMMEIHCPRNQNVIWQKLHRVTDAYAVLLFGSKRIGVWQQMCS